MSFFNDVALLPDDPIFSIPKLFANDVHSNKVNLGIGIYMDSEAKSIVLNCVRKAESQIFEQKLSKDYQPMDGNPSLVKATLGLIFGKGCEGIDSEKIYGAVTIGGTGALRTGADFLKLSGHPLIYIPNPSWPNHELIFTKAGLKIEKFPYYDEKTHYLHFSKLCDAITKMPPGSALLLQACCNNPTGIDPSIEQWKELSALIKKQKLIPFFDIAYQGLGTDFETDAKAIRYFYEQGHEVLVAYSFSKNMGLYGERLGLLAVATHDQGLSKKIGSNIRQIIRGNYSTPPLQSSRIASIILQSPELYKEWQLEISTMRARIQEMREAFLATLLTKSTKIDFEFIHDQKGMFTYCGLNPKQVLRLRNEYSIFTPADGRINVSGLNTQNMEYVIKSILTIFDS